jgi:hypothetical protein
MSDALKTSEPQTTGGVLGGACCRESGKSVLRGTIERLRKQADELEVFVNMLPEKPTVEQDNAIWSFACALRNR